MKTTYGLPVRDLAAVLGTAPSQIRRLLVECGQSDRLPSSRRVPPRAVRALLTSLGYEYPRRIIAFTNLKGGVGKTTSAVTIATRAVQYGFRTCVVDLDAQASASLALDALPGEEDLVFNDVWEDPAGCLPDAVRTIEDGLQILPSELENSLLDVSLSKPRSQKSAVRSVCKRLHAAGNDLIIIDCPPSLGAAVISASCAADTIVIPTACDAFSLRGIRLTIEEVGTIRETFGLPEVPMWLLPTMVDRRQKLTGETLERLEELYPDNLLPGSIRTTTEFAKALERRQTVFASNRKSPAKEDYDEVVRDLLELDVLSALMEQAAIAAA